MDDKTINAIVAYASFDYTVRGNWVFSQGERGDCMYILLHGQCKMIEINHSFIEQRRSLREQMLKMYELIDESISLESIFRKLQ